MKKLYNSLLPKHARVPLLIVLLFNIFVFYGIALLMGNSAHRHDPSISADSKIPFIPSFMLFYVLAYVQWVVTYIAHSHPSVESCYRLVAADLIAKFLCMLSFIFLPTQMTRPEITGSGFWEQCVNFMYTIDRPISLLPSLHCLVSWICFRTTMYLPQKRGLYIAAQGILTLLILASTVLIKQHTLLDVITGVLVAEIGLLLSNHCGLWRYVDKLQPPSTRRILAEQNASNSKS